MSTKRVIDTFEAWRAGGEPLVLATVIATEGSTYTKAGHRIIIAANGDYQGLVSGGCLEGDLAEHAKAVAAGGPGQLVTYDMRDEADELFGTGVGCNGAITILLQRLDAENDHEPFQTIVAAHYEPDGAVAAVITGGDDSMLGRTAIKVGDAMHIWGPDDDVSHKLTTGLASADPKRGTHLESLETVDGSVDVLQTRIPPLVRLLVLGAGPDALPLIRMAGELGWLVWAADHREEAVQQVAPLAYRSHCAPAAQLSDQLDLDDFAAVIVMSHNLEADRTYLGQLAETKIPYLGILGPRARRDRLVAELNQTGNPLDKKLHGPVGLDLGADSPEAIALSILAEIQGLIAERRQHYG